MSLYQKDINTLVHDGVWYLNFFEALSTALSPRSYFEIGTRDGDSAAKFNCDTICIDPEFRMEKSIIGKRKKMLFFQMTSNEFFETETLSNYFPNGPDIAFLDGMHKIEYILQDFINIEKYCHSRSLIFIHDCLPFNERMASREFLPGDKETEETWDFWTGDVWKILPILMKYRPDLRMFCLDCPPSGLAVISGIDSHNDTLSRNYYSIIGDSLSLSLKRAELLDFWRSFPILDSKKILGSKEDITGIFSLW